MQVACNLEEWEQESLVQRLVYIIIMFYGRSYNFRSGLLKLQERRENFLLHGQLCVLTLILVSDVTVLLELMSETYL